MYQTNVFDPWLIVSQIICVQGLYYASLSFLLFLCSLFSSVPLSIDQVFDPLVLVTLKSPAGRVALFAFLANAAVLGAFHLYVVVERAKKCLDHAATVHLLHFFLCALLRGVPSRAMWYVVVTLATVSMSVLGERLCMKKELRNIPRGFQHV